MYDLNFFSIPLKTTKRSAALVVGVVVIFLVIGAVAGFYFWQEWRATIIRTDIAGMNGYLGSEPVKSQLAELETVKQKTQLMQNYQTTFRVIDEYVKQSRLVNTELMEQVSSTLPKTVMFKSMSVMNMEIQIEATAPDSLPVAELVYNLKKTNLFSTVELMSISVDENNPTGIRVIKVRTVLKEVVAP